MPKRTRFLLAALMLLGALVGCGKSKPLDPIQGKRGIIVTVVGGYMQGSLDEGRPARTGASLYNPRGISLDASGNIYIADTFNHRIRRASPDGIITTIAGSGPTGPESGGFSGDGGPAIRARLNEPEGVAVDSRGNIYIADTLNHRIRRVSSDGIIITVAGTGATGPAARSSDFWQPTGVTVDATGNVYVADKNNHSIQRVSPNGTITVIAGSGPRGGSFGLPERGFSGDGGPALKARLNSPHGVALDTRGNLYFADAENHRIRRVDADGIIATIAGTGATGFINGGFWGDGGPALQARLNFPLNIVVDAAGAVYIADYHNFRIRRVSPDGMITTFAGTGNPYPLTGGREDVTPLGLGLSPYSVTLDANGAVYILDDTQDAVYRVNP